jgi:gamma-glutamyltranspeptidase/glutathione hydrolase
MAGAVAACGEAPATLGAEVLEDGGNAVDAAVAAMCAVYVAAPVMSSPAGGGVAVVLPEAGGEPEAWDFFPSYPGLPASGLAPRGAEFQDLVVDYGSGATQVFHVGRGAAAPPTALAGLLALQQAHGALPFEAIATRVAAMAREGVPLSPIQARFFQIFEALLTYDESVRAHFAPGGTIAGEGERLPAPGYAAALEEAARTGVDPLTRGSFRRPLLAEFGAPRGFLTAADLDAVEPGTTHLIRVRYRDAEVWLPGPPSLGGPLVALMLRALEQDPLPPAATPERAVRLGALMAAAEEEQGANPSGGEPGWATLDRAARVAARARELEAAGPPAPEPGPLPGNTTHVSAVDDRGGAVAITTSFGETCGVSVPGLGLAMNNMLGEEDLHPAGFHSGVPGTPLPTRMTPTLVRTGAGRVVALGTGGSHRITSVILQGVLRLVDQGRDLEEVVAAPRLHRCARGTYLEAVGLCGLEGGSSVAALKAADPGAKVFERADLYFGGLHVAGVDADGECRAVGDPRRDGAAATR